MLKKIFNILYFTLQSARYTTWLRIFAEMLFGFSFVSGVISVSDWFKFIAGFISVGPLLWTGAYMLNDLTDVSLDLQHQLRSKRPIASKKLSTESALLVIFMLFTLAIILGFIINLKFVIGLVVLLISQILYTVKPLRLKEKAPFDLLLNGANGGVRFVLGYLTVSENLLNIPIFFVMYFVILKIILFIGHRLQNKALEKTNKFKSTISILSDIQIRILLIFLMLVAIGTYVFSVFFYQMSWTFFLPPLIFLFLLSPMLASLKKSYLQKQESNLFWRVYLYAVFLIFSLLFFGVNKF